MKISVYKSNAEKNVVRSSYLVGYYLANYDMHELDWVKEQYIKHVFVTDCKRAGLEPERVLRRMYANSSTKYIVKEMIQKYRKVVA